MPNEYPNASTRPRPDPALLWGVSPKDTSTAADSKANADAQSTSTATAKSAKEEEEKPDWESYYDEETKAKLRAKGINPALKAEMEHGRKQGGKEGRFWGKVASTAMGGGWIK